MALQQQQENATRMIFPGLVCWQHIGRYLYHSGKQLGNMLVRSWAHLLTGLIVLIALLIPFLS